MDHHTPVWMHNNCVKLLQPPQTNREQIRSFQHVPEVISLNVHQFSKYNNSISISFNFPRNHPPIATLSKTAPAMPHWSTLPLCVAAAGQHQHLSAVEDQGILGGRDLPIFYLQKNRQNPW